MKNFMHDVNNKILEAIEIVVLLLIYPFIWVVIGGFWIMVKIMITRFDDEEFNIEECYESEELVKSYESAVNELIICGFDDTLMSWVAIGAVRLMRVLVDGMWAHSGNVEED